MIRKGPIGLFQLVLVALTMAAAVGARANNADLWLNDYAYFPMVGNCLYEEVPPGLVYVSLGADHAFMRAAKTASSALYVADVDPHVIRFAQINRALIAASADTTEYRHLRLEATAEEWSAAAAKFSNVDSMYKDALTRSDSWSWWNTQVRTNPYGNGFELMGIQPSATPNPETDAFTGFNYLWDQRLFQTLKTMTAKHRIVAEHTTNFIDIDEVAQMLSEIHDRLHMQIGAVDTISLQDNGQDFGSGASAAYYVFLAGNTPSYTVFINSASSWYNWSSYFGFTADTLSQLTYSQVTDLISGEMESLRTLGNNSYRYKCRFNEKDTGPSWHELPGRSQ